MSHILGLFIEKQAVSPIYANIKKEAERSIDQAEFSILKTEDVQINNRIECLFDLIPLEGLVGLYNFQQSVKDESTKINHGISSNLTFQKEYDFYGYEAVFNGYSSKITISNSADFDFAGKFDIMLWAKWASTDQEFVFARRSTTTNGFSLSVNNAVVGDVRFQIGSSSITSTTNALNDGEKHFIRICRDENNLITLYIDDVSEGTVTSSYDTTCDFDLLLGTDTITDYKISGETEGLNENVVKKLNSSFVKKTYNETEQTIENIVRKLNTSVIEIKKHTTDIQGVTENVVKKLTVSSNYFTGKLIRMRIYKGEIKTTTEATKIFSSVNPRSTLKFGGRVTKIDTDLTINRVTAQSYGKILAETDVRGEVFLDKYPEEILESLITANTSLIFNDRAESSPFLIETYTADGKLIDIVRDFSTMAGKIFYTTPLEEFIIEPADYNSTNRVFTHGENHAIIQKVSNDDTQLINSVILIGKVFEYTTTETLSGANGSKKVFFTNFKPKSAKITVNGVIQDFTAYTVDSNQKAIIFYNAPANGANIIAEYNYELPLTVKGTRQSSISEYGIHSKQFNMAWVSTREDAVRFIQSYLNKYREVKKSVSLTFGEPVLEFAENDVIHAINTHLDLNEDLVIKSLAWEYPKINTVITLGDFRFEFLEADKEITKKIHDFESSINQNKDIEDYESPEEELLIGDIVVELISESFSETLNIVDATNKTSDELNSNTYRNGTYGSYASLHTKTTASDVYSSSAVT